MSHLNKRSVHSLCAGLVIACISATVNAAEVSLKFSGQLTSVRDSFGFLSGQFAPGTIFDGVITYDTNGPEGSTTTSDPTSGIYSAVKSFRTSIGGYVFDGEANSFKSSVLVWDNHSVGQSVVDSVSFFSPLDYTPPIDGMGPGLVVASAYLMLFDFTHTASQNGKAMTSSIDLSRYGSTVFSAHQINLDTKQSFFLDGIVNSLNSEFGPVPVPVQTPIPEPESYAMLLAGLGLLGAKKRYRRQKLNV